MRKTLYIKLQFKDTKTLSQLMHHTIVQHELRKYAQEMDSRRKSQN